MLRRTLNWVLDPYEKKGLPAHSCCKLAAMFAASLQQLRVRFGMQMRSCRTHVRLAATFPTNIQNIDAASCNHSCTCPAHKCCQPQSFPHMSCTYMLLAAIIPAHVLHISAASSKLSCTCPAHNCCQQHPLSHMDFDFEPV